jgi:membrane protein DedA with SNARE-associated domain
MAAVETEIVTADAGVPVVVPKEPAPRRRIGIKDVLCVGPIITHSIYYYAGLPLNAILIGMHPVLLSALRGSIASMVASGGSARIGSASLALAVVAPIPVLMFTDPFYFWAGRRYGRSLLNYLGRNDARWRKRIARGERFFKRFGVGTIILAPFLPVPSSLFYLAAGEAGMRFIVFILADLLGTLMFIGVIVGLGFAIGQPAVSVAEAMSRYALWVIIGTVVLVVLWSVWGSWRAQREDSGPPAM